MNSKKLLVYGTIICPDCAEVIDYLTKQGISFDFLEFSDTTAHLKTFLKHRDTNPLFDSVKAEGLIGIPCFEYNDGSLTFDVDEAIRHIS